MKVTIDFENDIIEELQGNYKKIEIGELIEGWFLGIHKITLPSGDPSKLVLWKNNQGVCYANAVINFVDKLKDSNSLDFIRVVRLMNDSEGNSVFLKLNVHNKDVQEFLKK